MFVKMIGVKHLILFVTICILKDVWCTIMVDTAIIEGSEIVGGHIAPIIQYPYDAIIVLTNGVRRFRCGGSIISSKFILTAAHCVYGKTKASVGTGVTNIHELEGTTNIFKRVPYSYSKALYYHDQYDPNGTNFDIGLIELKKPIRLDGVKRKVITLMNSGADISVGTIISVTGWGLTSENGSLSDNLREVDVTKLPDSLCAKAYTKDFNAQNMICAGSKKGGKDSCQGDSGGPAVDKKTKKQVGIVSFGLGCARKDFPGVYAKVGSAPIRSWIKKIAGV